MPGLIQDLQLLSDQSNARPRRLAATCLAAILIAAGLAIPAHSQTALPLDTSTLPRPGATTPIYAGAPTTILSTAAAVPAAATATLAVLEAAGWQRYLAPFTQYAPQVGSETYYLKKGGQALTLVVSSAPAQNSTTNISYTALPLERELPFPAGASGILFSPERLHLDAEAPQSPEALFAFYRAQLPASGWTLHSASDGSAGMKIQTNEGMHHGFFTHPRHGALHVSVKKANDGRSTVAIRSVPASVLPGAQVAQAPEPPKPAPPPNTSAHAETSQKIDALAQDLIKQALQPPPPGAAAAAALAAAQLQARMQAQSQPGAATPKVATAPAPPAQPEPALERDEIGGYPVPKPYSSKEQSRSQWRIEVNATVKAGVASVLAFYRSELGTRGWREQGEARVESGRTILTWTSPDGPAVLTLEGKGGETKVNLLLRKEAEARASGMMPKAGQAKVMLGSILDSESVVSIAGRSIKVAPGVGEKTKNGPTIDLPPGTHKVQIRTPGQPTVTETVTVKANEIWGLLLGPGGALPLQMY